MQPVTHFIQIFGLAHFSLPKPTFFPYHVISRVFIGLKILIDPGPITYADKLFLRSNLSAPPHARRTLIGQPIGTIDERRSTNQKPGLIIAAI
jgi:hypothetical protein